jgi:hypothetical protein
MKPRDWDKTRDTARNTSLQIEPVAERIRFLGDLLWQMPLEFRLPVAVAALNQLAEFCEMDEKISMFLAVAPALAGEGSDAQISPAVKDALFEASDDAREKAPELVVLVAATRSGTIWSLVGAILCGRMVAA